MRRRRDYDALMWGQSRTLTPLIVTATPRTEQVLRALDLQRDADDPIGWGLTIGWVPSATAWLGQFNVVANIVWTIGGAEAALEIDVPAGGTSIVLGAADSVEVRGRVETSVAGIPAVTARLSAMLTLTTAPQGRAPTRTHIWTFPADSGVPRVIPAFARGVRVEVSDPLILPAMTLVVLSDTGGTQLFTRPVNAGELMPLCGAAYGYDFTCAAAGGANAIWEIQP